jgi:hypothetical protein
VFLQLGHLSFPSLQVIYHNYDLDNKFTIIVFEIIVPKVKFLEVIVSKVKVLIPEVIVPEVIVPEVKFPEVKLPKVIVLEVKFPKVIVYEVMVHEVIVLCHISFLIKSMNDIKNYDLKNFELVPMS